MIRPAYFFCPECGAVIGKVALRSDGTVRKLTTNPHQIYELSAREQQILAEALKGKTNQMIAEAMCLSIHTVKNHMTHIYRKLGCLNRASALLLAAKRLGNVEIEGMD